jgi:DeoR/GlpR family transcriptional regulator of sugar metabolism
LEYIQQNRSGRIDKLAALLDVSEATIRRDLFLLETDGLVKRSHGGAVLPEASTSFEHLYQEKSLLYSEEKQLIGKEAAALVSDGETLILDSGSTVLTLAQCLTRCKNLTIITHDLYIAGLAYDPSTTVIVTGGIVRGGFNVLIGSIAENFIRQVKVNKTFLGADAVDLDQGVTNATFNEVPIKQLSVAAASQVILLADHTKFGKTALVKVCAIDRLNQVITDEMEDSMRQDFIRQGIPVTIAAL